MDDVKKLSDLAFFLKDKDFAKMRKWVVNNSDIEVVKIYRAIFDSMYTIFKPESIPQAVLILSKYMYQSAFVADQKIIS